ncbi:MAG: magnesium transporter [Pseudomonadota bacterium]
MTTLISTNDTEFDPALAETAAQHAVTRVPTARASETVREVLARLPGHAYDYAGSVYVLDDAARLLGMAHMAQLLAASPEQTILAAARTDFPEVFPETDQEAVASLAIVHGLTAVPVVDRERRLVGVVPPDAMFNVLRREHVEDLHRLAGIRRETLRARNAMEAPPMRRARDRLPWLLVGLAGSMLATLVMSWFEAALQAKLAIAFFVPAIVYLADAVGTQSEAIAVRGLSLSNTPVRELIGGELRTGLLIGLSLGALTLPFTWLVFGDWQLAFAVALSLVVAGSVATTIGLGFPWLLARLGKDPAYGSGPIATIIQDVLSLIIYFTIATLLVM